MVFGRKRGLVAMALPTPVHFSLDVSEGFDRVLEDLAEKTGRSRSEVLAKAVALMAIAVEAKEQGKKIGFAERDESHLTEITGI